MGFPESRIRAPALGRRQRAAASAGLREVSKTPREGRRHKLPDVGNFFAKEPPDRTPRKHEKLLYF